MGDSGENHPTHPQAEFDYFTAVSGVGSSPALATCDAPGGFSRTESKKNQRTIGPENAHLKPDLGVLSHNEMTLTLNTHTPLLTL